MTSCCKMKKLVLITFFVFMSILFAVEMKRHNSHPEDVVFEFYEYLLNPDNNHSEAPDIFYHVDSVYHVISESNSNSVSHKEKLTAIWNCIFKHKKLFIMPENYMNDILRRRLFGYAYLPHSTLNSGLPPKILIYSPWQEPGVDGIVKTIMFDIIKQDGVYKIYLLSTDINGIPFDPSRFKSFPENYYRALGIDRGE